jgi:hypothetical protein
MDSARKGLLIVAFSKPFKGLLKDIKWENYSVNKEKKTMKMLWEYYC